MTSLIARYQESLNECRNNNFTDNYDYRRFGPAHSGQGISRSLRQVVKRLLTVARLYRPHTVEQTIMAHAAELNWLYARLGDQESCDLLVMLLAYRTLGHRRVKLPLNTPEYWRAIERMDQVAHTAETIDLGFKGWKAYMQNFTQFGLPLVLFAVPKVAYNQLILQQYRCRVGKRVIEVSPGETVLDCGACYGETALYFALKTGEQGRVFSFEFVPENLRVFHRNMELNSEIAGRIKLLECPLWSKSGQELSIQGKGPGARVLPTSNNGSARRVQTVSIDDVMRIEKLDKIDFIKMDIEGAELQALKGAESCLRRFKPKLAISVYHNIHDFWEIPLWLSELDLGYQFYLRHFTIHREETILFAEVPDRGDP